MERQVDHPRLLRAFSNLALGVSRDGASTNCQLWRDLFLISRKSVVEECECPTGEPNTIAPNSALILCQNENIKNPLETSDGTGSGRKRNLTRDISTLWKSLESEIIIKSKLCFLEIRSAWGSFRLLKQSPKSCNCRQLLHDVTAVGKAG